MPVFSKISLSKLKNFKDSLLDVSRRNRMINTNFNQKGKQFFRIIDEVPQKVYEKLITGKMNFKPLRPFNDENRQDESTPEFLDNLNQKKLLDEEYLSSMENANGDSNLELMADLALRDRLREEMGMQPIRRNNLSLREHAEHLGLNPSFNLLEDSDENRHNDREIQTLFTDDQLKSSLSTIKRQYSSSLKEAGINPLYVCFGFLQWGHDAQEEKFNSPILMLQVDIHDEGGKIKISSTGEDLSINQTLSVKLKTDFNFSFPELIPDENEEKELNIVEYFDLLKNEVEQQRDWKIINQVSFGIYNAQYMPIYEDINNLIENPSDLIEKLLSGERNLDLQTDKYDLDSREIQEITPALVVEADFSQHSAVIDVLKEKNLIIKGPPGTGKSQTITNIISSLACQGKKVLFVAQKQAALDVVRNNLIHVGLSDFLLEVFSVKANKKTLFEKIKNRYDKRTSVYPLNNSQRDRDKLYEAKNKLNEYAKKLNANFKETDRTIHQIIWTERKDDLPQELQSLRIRNIESINQEDIDEGKRKLSRLKDSYEKYCKEGDLLNSSLIFINKIDSFNDDLKEIKDLLESLEKLKEKEDKLPKEFFQKKENDFLKKIIDFWKEGKDYFEDLKILNHESLEKENLKNKFIQILNLKITVQERENYEKRIQTLKKSEKDKKDIDREVKRTEDKKFSNDDIKEIENLLVKANIFARRFPFLSRKYSGAISDYYSLFKVKAEIKDFSREEAITKIKELYKKKTVDIPKLEKKIKKLKKEILISKESKNFPFDQKSDEIEGLIFNVLHNFLFSQKKDDDNEIRKLVSSKSKFLESFINYINEEIKEDISSKLDSILRIYEIDTDEINKNSSNEELLFFFQKIQSKENYLKDYRNWLNSVSALISHEEVRVKSFYEEIINLNVNYIEQIDDYFEKVIIENLYEDARKDIGDLADEFNKIKLESLKDDLSLYDQRIRENYRLEIKAKIHGLQESAPIGNSTRRVRDKTELNLIEHISSTPGARVSVRDVMTRAKDALFSYMPCALMSPITVSQTLPLDEIFDVVVIDEASQMKPEYSIGAIARAKQVIIVGDQKQLPPTDFFKTNTGVHDDLDEDDIDESILDLGINAFDDVRELLFHYRSRHEDLIRFSNQKFYDKKLLIPASTDKEAINRGIERRYVENGFYNPRIGGGSGGININEAKELVAEIKNFMEFRKDESLGIATMNTNQRDLIQSEFDQIKDEPDIRDYIEKWKNKDEGLNEFFIKNLENIQGDERDVIFISTIYGKEEGKQVLLQRFGPINRPQGHRRLNVLFTRAKHQIILFTSLKSSEVRVGEKSSQGLEVFRDYLIYAEDGSLPLEIQQNNREVESPFQQWAIDIINAQDGFKADWEVGVDGFRIDIGVKHENCSGYILGVETDGATYHSSQSARDRDILRQEILEGHGWVFHRIWSTDWLNDKSGTKQKLINAIQNRLSEIQN